MIIMDQVRAPVDRNVHPCETMRREDTTRMRKAADWSQGKEGVGIDAQDRGRDETKNRSEALA